MVDLQALAQKLLNLDEPATADAYETEGLTLAQLIDGYQAELLRLETEIAARMDKDTSKQENAYAVTAGKLRAAKQRAAAVAELRAAAARSAESIEDEKNRRAAAAYARKELKQLAEQMTATERTARALMEEAAHAQARAAVAERIAKGMAASEMRGIEITMLAAIDRLQASGYAQPGELTGYRDRARFDDMGRDARTFADWDQAVEIAARDLAKKYNMKLT